MEADTISYLRAVCQHRIHRNSPMARQKSEVFDDLVSDGPVRIDEEGNSRITNGGKRLKEMLANFRKRFGSTAPKKVGKSLREQVKGGKPFA